MASTLSDYAIIGDCRAAAMVSKNGSIDWLCLPDFSSPSLFAKMLDEDKGGHFLITLYGLTKCERRYLPDTAVLETILTSPQGGIRILDCMPVPEQGENPALLPLREILRHVEVLEGEPVIEVHVMARPHYARKRGAFRNRGALGWSMRSGRAMLNLISDFPLSLQKGDLYGSAQATKGQRFWLSLTFDDHAPRILLPLGDEAQERLSATVEWWKNWCNTVRYNGEWRDQVVRSAVTLRLLTFAQSGALIAAATTSLPERPHGWMNWDYRYCWPRDSAVALSAFMHLGLHDEAGAFFDWLLLAANTTRPRISNMYDIYGRSHITEKLLPYLSGYQNAKPVRIGNVLTEQTQHDVYGEVMMAVENWVNHSGALEPSERALIEGFGKALAKMWREPDNGIWEIRDKREHYVYSKVMAWYVFDSLVRLREKNLVDGPMEMYRRERDELRERIEREGFNKQRNCFTAIFGGDTVDASLLMLPRCGFVTYDDPRMLGTWEAIQRDLEQNGLILRYPPGFGGSQPGEGAFIICNFWAVSYLTGLGRYGEARERLARLAALANDVGLFNEGVDVETAQPLGNMPQAYSHAGFITAVTRLHDGIQRIREAA